MASIGLDIGYGNVKIVSESHRHIYPSLVAPYDDSFHDIMPMQNNPAVVLYKGAKYVVGHDAARIHSATPPSLFRDWIVTDTYKILLLSAFRRLGTDSVSMVTGLPISYYKKDKSRLAVVIEDVARQERIRIERLKVYPQPLLAYFDYILDGSGREAEGTATDEDVLVLDIGYFTMDWIVIRGSFIDPSLTGSEEMGFSKIVQMVQKAVFEKYDVKLDSAQVQHVIRRGRLTVKGIQHDLKNDIDRVREIVIRSIVNIVRSSVPIDTLKVLLAGGGAEFFRGYAGRLINGRILDNPAMAIASGAWKVAKRGQRK